MPPAAERLHGAKQPKGWRVRRVAFGLPGISPVTLRPTSRGEHIADLWNRMTNIAAGTARKTYPIASGNPLTLDGESP
jgi:hypothetical protein